MRHRKSFNKLNRTASHRKAMLANMATQVFLHKKIRTTFVKAKATRPLVERLITFAKKGTIAARREVIKTVSDKTVVKELFDNIAPTFEDRAGGYTRIIKIGRRLGDGAELAFLELVGFEGLIKAKKEKATKKAEQKKAKEKEKAEKASESEVVPE